MRARVELLLYFIGIPALAILAVEAADHIEHSLSAGDRAEKKKLYSIVGDQEVSRIATKYISGSMICIDSFNDTKLPMEFEKVWVRAQDPAEEFPLRFFVDLSTDRRIDRINGFLQDVAPSSCRIENEELKLPFVIDEVRNLSAICNREAAVSQIVRQSIDSSFWIRSENGDYLNGSYVETQYDVDCELKVLEVRDCLPRNYGDKLRSSLKHEYYFGAFTEYNYCDNPENAEFKRQVLNKWESPGG